MSWLPSGGVGIGAASVRAGPEAVLAVEAALPPAVAAPTVEAPSPFVAGAEEGGVAGGGTTSVPSSAALFTRGTAALPTRTWVLRGENTLRSTLPVPLTGPRPSCVTVWVRPKAVTVTGSAVATTYGSGVVAAEGGDGTSSTTLPGTMAGSSVERSSVLPESAIPGQSSWLKPT